MKYKNFTQNRKENRTRINSAALKSKTEKRSLAKQAFSPDRTFVNVPDQTTASGTLIYHRKMNCHGSAAMPSRRIKIYENAIKYTAMRKVTTLPSRITAVVW